MKRELKFRAWDIVKKLWITGDRPFWIIGEVTVFDMLKQYSIENFNDINIVQYTGMQDCSFIDIFEGYLVKFDGDKVILEIKMHQGEWVGIDPKTQDVYSKLCNHLNRISVVGNIYENPDLLK